MPIGVNPVLLYPVVVCSVLFCPIIVCPVCPLCFWAIEISVHNIELAFNLNSDDCWLVLCFQVGKASKFQSVYL